jgi:predicted dehydrogenase
VVREIPALTGVFACEPLHDAWLSSVDSGGGALLYLGSQLADMLLWFVGDDVAEVSSSIRPRAGAGTGDTSAFQIHFACGAVAQCLVT